LALVRNPHQIMPSSAARPKRVSEKVQQVVARAETVRQDNRVSTITLSLGGEGRVRETD